MFHIYKEIDFEREPLCYYKSDADEYGMLLEFETEESAKRFIESAVESGERPEEFFDGFLLKRMMKSVSLAILMLRTCTLVLTGSCMSWAIRKDWNNEELYLY